MPFPQQDLPTGAALQDGKYRVVRKLGQGGFGITYLAIHRNFGEVALKELFISSGNTQCSRDTTSGRTVIPQFDAAAFQGFKDRFLSEAKTLYNLREIKGVVRIIDIFEENDTVYFAMDYLNGEKLDEFVQKRRPVSETEAMRVVTEIANTLKNIHAKNVLHRDLKPSNIIISGSTGEVTLIDFGIARDYAGDDEKLTHTTFHSPRFSPPEQKIARARMGPYSDVYALGAIAYYVFSGELPQSIEERTTDGYHAPNAFNKEIPGHIVETIDKAVALRVEDRTASVGDFLRMFLGERTGNSGYANDTTIIEPQPPAPQPVVVQQEHTVIDHEKEGFDTQIAGTSQFIPFKPGEDSERTRVEYAQPRVPTVSFMDQIKLFLKSVPSAVWIGLLVLILAVVAVVLFVGNPPQPKPPVIAAPVPAPAVAEKAVDTLPNFTIVSIPEKAEIKIGQVFTTRISLFPEPKPSYQVKMFIDGEIVNGFTDNNYVYKVKGNQPGTKRFTVKCEITNPADGSTKNFSETAVYEVLSPNGGVISVDYKLIDRATMAKWMVVNSFGDLSDTEPLVFGSVKDKRQAYARFSRVMLETRNSPMAIEMSPAQSSGKKVMGRFTIPNLPDQASFSTKVGMLYEAEPTADVMVTGRIYAASSKIKEGRFTYRKTRTGAYGNISEDLSRFSGKTVIIEIYATAQSNAKTNRVFLIDPKITGQKHQ